MDPWIWYRSYKQWTSKKPHALHDHHNGSFLCENEWKIRSKCQNNCCAAKLIAVSYGTALWQNTATQDKTKIMHLEMCQNICGNILEMWLSSFQPSFFFWIFNVNRSFCGEHFFLSERHLFPSILRIPRFIIILRLIQKSTNRTLFSLISPSKSD